MAAVNPQELEQCKLEVAAGQSLREEIPEIVRQLVDSCGEGCFEHISPEPIPSREAGDRSYPPGLPPPLPRLFYPPALDMVNLSYYFGQEAVAFFEALAEQITLSIRHECLRYDLPCTHCEERGQEEAIRFMRGLAAPASHAGHGRARRLRGRSGRQKL